MPEDDLFGFADVPRRAPPGLAAELRPRLDALARHDLYLGTSSWKYPGWRGSIYSEERYATRNKFSETKFDRECLAEYGETFHTVGLDAGYYRFPTPEYIGGLVAQVPAGFQFGIKVTEDITIKRYPNLPKHGLWAGRENPNFLNADLFRRMFLAPCEAAKENIGPLMFEFSAFAKQDFAHPNEFFERLDRFLGALPRGWRYSVELRNRDLLVPEYFEVLRRHGTAHVFNNWTRMPSALEQLALENTDTADFMVARLLLKPGRRYEEAVQQFQPYETLQEANDDARYAAELFLERAFKYSKRGYIYINNRLEGFAPGTIREIIRRLEEQGRRYVLIT